MYDIYVGENLRFNTLTLTLIKLRVLSIKMESSNIW